MAWLPFPLAPLPFPFPLPLLPLPALVTAATAAATGEALLNAVLAPLDVDAAAFAPVVEDELQTVLLAMFRLALLVVAAEPRAIPCVTLWKSSFTSPSAEEILNLPGVARA